MSKNYNHRECFEFYDTVPRNLRWSWSGKSVDGQHVAVTLWQDRFEEQGRIYRSWKTDHPGEWRSRPGFVELIDNLAHSRDKLGGRVHVILAQARDKDVSPRSILRCFPQKALKMRVLELDEQEGTFVLERVDKQVPA
ncbi:hypothetical protein [uncultured Sphingomonas sp.]|uniref:hypothetical protein n=1 Tax=uncultured Sphingomonas sp. TaxID=158754 RepID=UPI0035CC7062